MGTVARCREDVVDALRARQYRIQPLLDVRDAAQEAS